MFKGENKKYVIFLCIIIPCFVFFMLSNLLFSSGTTSVSQNYQSTITFSDYYLKIDKAMYNAKTKELTFSCYVKIKYENGQTEPEIYSVALDYDIDTFAEFNVSHDTLNEYEYEVVVPNVNEKFKYIQIFYQSKKPDTYIAEKYDEFGNVIPEQTIEGEMVYLQILIDRNDVEFVENTKPTTTSSENVSHDTFLTTTSPASTTSTTATPQTSSVVTTTTVATTKLEPVTMTTTTTVATKKPTSESLTTTSKATTTTTNKSTTTTAKKTTTTKKATTTTTTAKKTTTTKVTTTKATTTTVYVKLTGLEIQQKGQENLVLGESVTLTPIFHPNKATNKKLTWISNRTDRVLVDENGKCTAVGEGAAIITCVSDDGGLRASYMIVGVDG